MGEMEQAQIHLDRGLAAAREMQSRYQRIELLNENPTLAERIGHNLELTRRLVETNNTYLKTCFAYFAYREQPEKATKAALVDSLLRLQAARGRFRAAPGSCYDLAGVDQLGPAQLVAYRGCWFSVPWGLAFCKLASRSGVG